MITKLNKKIIYKEDTITHGLYKAATKNQIQAFCYNRICKNL